MPKVSVYLPDELYRQARERGLSLSALTQRAVEDELQRSSLAEWVARERHTPPRLDRSIDTSNLMEEVRQEFGG